MGAFAMGGPAVAERPRSDRDDVVRLRTVVRELGWARELRVLAVKVCFSHRTGGRAPSSDVHGDTVVGDLPQHLTDVGPADRVARIGTSVFIRYTASPMRKTSAS
jgi:hypothetical protein